MHHASCIPLYHVRILHLSILCCLFLGYLASPSYAFMSDRDIASFQKQIADKPVGERIALWAEKFVGAPYDPDPLGEYVTKKAIIADARVDCMYLSFRAVELALGVTPEDAINIALDKRFITKGRLDGNGNVANYEDRFQYGEDMLDSGKWGKEVTEELGRVKEIKGSRGKDKVKILSKEILLKSIKVSSASGGQRVKDSDTMTLWRSDTLRSGDFIFFIKAPEKRKAGEIVGHIGIIKVEDKGQSASGGKGSPRSGGFAKAKKNQKEEKEIYLIHAGGAKNKGGKVKKEMLYDYVKSMPFIGVRVSRLN